MICYVGDTEFSFYGEVPTPSMTWAKWLAQGLIKEIGLRPLWKDSPYDEAFEEFLSQNVDVLSGFSYNLCVCTTEEEVRWGSGLV